MFQRSVVFVYYCCLKTDTHLDCKQQNANAYRLAELAIDKLHRKSNILYLHILLTMDCLLIDECTQLSAQLFSILDIILRNVRHNSLRTFTCLVTLLPFL